LGLEGSDLEERAISVSKKRTGLLVIPDKARTYTESRLFVNGTLAEAGHEGSFRFHVLGIKF
jgi:hypothetical protein